MYVIPNKENDRQTKRHRGIDIAKTATRNRYIHNVE